MKLLVSKSVLFFIAGIMWAGVGAMLIIMGSSWLDLVANTRAILFATIGVILALIIYFGGFYKLVDKNLGRISAMKERNIIFSFISWKSYLIIPFMIMMGLTLRHSEIPKQYLAIAYIGMGGALFLSSTKFFSVLLKKY